MTSESALERRFDSLVLTRLGGSTHKLAPVEAGMPDRLVLLPGGRMELVELKTEDGELRPVQRTWHRKAAKRGTVVSVLSGSTEVLDWVERRLAEA